MNTAVLLSVKFVCDKLNDDDLATFNNFLNGFGNVPTDHPLFERVKGVLNADGTAHDEVKSCLAHLMLERVKS